MRRVSEFSLGFLFAVAIAVAIVALTADPQTYHQICETNQYSGKESCAPHNIIYVIIWYFGRWFDVSAAVITAIATGFIAYFTRTLKRSTDRLWDAGERQLQVIRDNADQQSRDMQASVAASNVANALTREIFIAEQRPWLRWSVPPGVRLERNGPRLTIKALDGTLTNVGRLPATNIAYFGRLYFPPPGIGAINLGQAYFAEHMREAETTLFSLASIMPGETVPMRFGPHGIEIDQLPDTFTLWLAFHARYMFAIGGTPNPRAIAEIGAVYHVQPIAAKTLNFERDKVIHGGADVSLVEFTGARLLT